MHESAYHHIAHAPSFFPDEVLGRDFDVVKLNVGRSRGDVSANFQPPHANAGLILEGDKQQG